MILVIDFNNNELCSFENDISGEEIENYMKEVYSHLSGDEYYFYDDETGEDWY